MASQRNAADPDLSDRSFELDRQIDRDNEREPRPLLRAMIEADRAERARLATAAAFVAPAGCE